MTRLSCDPARQIGTVSEVGPSHVRLNLPFAIQTARRHHGERIAAGEVGEMILIESDEFYIVGRTEEVALLERERTVVEPRLGNPVVSNPVGLVRLLATFDVVKGVVTSGVTRHPRLGDRVFGAPATILELLAGCSTGLGDVTLAIGHPPAQPTATVSVTPEALLGRHCAVLGTTGSGKSWTISRLVQEMAQHDCKVVVIDATGEFKTMESGVRHVHIGRALVTECGSEEISFPYSDLLESDLFAIFRPSGQSQTPKLRAAIKSLKLARVVPELASEGVVRKANQPRAPFDRAYRENADFIGTPNATIDIERLASQIDAECVWQTSQRDPSRFGDHMENERAYCMPLIGRVEEIVGASEMACIMRPANTRSFDKVFSEFLADSEERVLRVSFEHLAFARNVREIVANAIGRQLLDSARRGRFLKAPVVVIVDEAHQFLGKVLGDEFSRHELDAFDLIAKEGRKYGLTIVLSTQRPRDIAEGVMSQMGSFIVHRLTNVRDREIVERAASHLDLGAAQFIPVLAPGEALLLGVGFPVSMVVSILAPHPAPLSEGPKFQEFWKAH